MKNNIIISVQTANKRHDAFMSIINYFTSKNVVKEIFFTNEFTTHIAIADWDKPNVNPMEVCDMVDILIIDCPHQEFFTLERKLNCVSILHKNIFHNK